MARTYFDELREFNADHGIAEGPKLLDRLNVALNKKRFSPSVVALSEAGLAEFLARWHNVFERLDSVGFMAHVLEQQWEESWSFLRRVYSPDGGVVKWGAGVDVIGGSFDVATVRYSLEAMVFLSGSLCEYVSRASGVAIAFGNNRTLEALRDHLTRHSAPEASALRAVLNARESLWKELQGTAFRDRFPNADTGPIQTRSLRDVVAHYWALRLNPLQFHMARDGRIIADDTVEPGAWSWTPGARGADQASPRPPNWGEGKGVRTAALALRDDVRGLVEEVLGIFVPDEMVSGSVT